MEMQEMLKIPLVGVSGSGKTSLIDRFIDNTFQNQTLRIRPDFPQKKIKVNNVSYKLHIWEKYYRNDSAPQEIMDPIFYRKSSGVIYVFDCIKQPFENLEKSITQIRKYLPNEGDDVPIIIAFTKIDLLPPENVDLPEKLILIAKKNHFNIVCCSSKTGFGVDEVFLSLISEINSNLDVLMANNEKKKIKDINDKYFYSCF